MRVLTAVAAVVVGVVSFCGVRPAAAQDAEGSKVFERDCTLHMRSLFFGPATIFFASDEGDGCGDYYLRSVRITSTSGFTAVRTLSQSRDGNRAPDLEQHEIFGDGSGFAWGQVNVYVPYKARCHRYRLEADSSVRLIDSRPCTGDPHPPDTKAFKKDCAVVMDHGEVFDTGRTAVAAQEFGTECGEYRLRGLGVVSTTGQHVAIGISDLDDDPDPDLEHFYASVQGDVAYATLNVFIPYRARCDRFRYFPDRTIRYLESMPCSGS